MTKALEVRDVTKTFRIYERPEHRLVEFLSTKRMVRHTEFTALRGVSFDVGRGETVGIVGRNGSGKSTLLQIACGIVQPTTGSITVNGRVAALLELGAGFNGEFSGRENVYLNGSILGLTTSEIDERFDRIAAFADIGPFLDRPVKTYSSGMFVRLAFATAISVDPDILVVDEALSVGDEAFQRKCFARIEQLKDSGTTLLFVSHSAQTMIQLCDRVVLLDQGMLLFDGAPKAAVAHYQHLVNATDEAASAIRQKILSARGGIGTRPHRGPNASTDHLGDARVVSGDDNADATTPRGTPSLRDDTPAQIPKSSIDDREQYNPHLVSLSATANEERGARINSATIRTLGDRPVNVLRMGKRYQIVIEALFSVDATDVSFGFMVRLPNGTALAGASTQRNREMRLTHVAAGATVLARFEFTNALLPGTYFMNCGVRGRTGDTEISLHRIVDVLTFVVLPEPQFVASGHFDLSVTTRLTNMPSPATSAPLDA